MRKMRNGPDKMRQTGNRRLCNCAKSRTPSAVTPCLRKFFCDNPWYRRPKCVQICTGRMNMSTGSHYGPATRADSRPFQPADTSRERCRGSVSDIPPWHSVLDTSGEGLQWARCKMLRTGMLYARWAVSPRFYGGVLLRRSDSASRRITSHISRSCQLSP